MTRATSSSLLLLLAASAVATTTMPTTTTAQTATAYPLIAGYIPYSNVTQHLRLDLDVDAFDEYVDNSQWANAIDVYLNGRNSFRSTGLRKLANFSTDARGGPNPMTGHKYFEMYASYWGADTYAHQRVMSALQGTGEFAGAPDIVRTESAAKAVQYEVVWMYTIGEFEDAVGDCRAQNLQANDGLAHSWDEGVAFYTGSLEGTAGATGQGIMSYALAQTRCSQFGVCNSRGKSIINSKLVGLFSQGQALVRAFECDLAYQVKEDIVALMTVPLIQGWMRYLWRADPTAGWTGTTSNYAKEKAEGWAFLAAFLPQLNKCSPSAAATLRQQLHWKASPYLAMGRDAAFKLVQDQFACMRVNCADVGNMTESGQVVFRACAGLRADGTPSTPSAAAHVSHAALSVVLAWTSVVALVLVQL